MSGTDGGFISNTTLENWEKKLGLKEKNFYNDLLGKIEDFTKIRRLYVATVVVVILSFYLIYGQRGGLVCDIIAIVYPISESVKLLKTPNPEGTKKWLSYWIIVGILSIIDTAASGFTRMYWLVKAIFLMWCMLPIPNNGASTIYKTTIAPFFVER